MNDENSTKTYHIEYSVGTTNVGSGGFYDAIYNVLPTDNDTVEGDSDLKFPQGTTQPITQQPTIQPPEKESLEARVKQLEKMVDMRGKMVFEEITLRDIKYEDAKKEILDYFKKSGDERVYVSDILNDLRIEPELIMTIMDELEEEGVIGEKAK